MNRRILVIGGTNFFGRHIVETLLENDYNVVLLNRCKSNTILFPELERICADRSNENLKELVNKSFPYGNNTFHCIIDVNGYDSNVLENTMEALYNKTKYYVFISSTAVNHIDVIEPMMKNYALQKKRCEDIIINHFCNDCKQGNRHLIVRPFYLCGDYDDTKRFDYSEWPKVKWSNGDEVDYDNVKSISKKIINLIESNYYGIFDSDKSGRIK